MEPHTTREEVLPLDGAARIALFAGLVLILQAAVPPALAHGGADHGEGSSAGGEGIFKLTPDREFAEQHNPAMDGSRIVWQERAPGEDWDIMMANIDSPNISAIPLTNTDYNEQRPLIHGDYVAWVVKTPDDSDEDLAVLNLNTGLIRHVPDSGKHEQHPTFGGNGSLYYRVPAGGKAGHLKGFDPSTGETFNPIGDTTIVGEPAAYGPWLAWAEGSPTRAKFHILNTHTGNLTKVKHQFHLKDGPEMGPAGLAWIASYGGEFERGTYSTLYNLSTGLNRLQSEVYPHKQVETCNAGVIWNQPSTSITEQPTVAFFDRFIEGTITVGEQTFDGDCGADHLVYEQNVRKSSDSNSEIRQLYVLSLESVRLPRESTVTIDEDDRRRILRARSTLQGEIFPGDPREPIQRVLASIDGGPTHEINFTRIDEGVRWEATIEPRVLKSGRHELEITAVDDLDRRTSEGFVFYTETPFQLDQSSLGDGPNVPREPSSEFPLSIFNHYQDYQPFYNTVFLVLLILGAAGWYGYKRYKEKPVGRPEYVPPDEIEG